MEEPQLDQYQQLENFYLENLPSIDPGNTPEYYFSRAKMFLNKLRYNVKYSPEIENYIDQVNQHIVREYQTPEEVEEGGT